jgi:hypothetical protein
MIRTFVWTPSGFKPTVNKKVAVVCFANGMYTPFASRLTSTIHRWNPEIPVYVFNDFAEIGSPTQKEDPYAFKLYAIDAVRKKGHDIVLWCDSVLQLTQPLDTLIQEIESVGVYLADDGMLCWMFANDRSLEYYGLTRDEAKQAHSIWACFMGFDFRNPRTHLFFAKWKEALAAGLFRGKHTNADQTESKDLRCRGHRHDQTCAELIAYTHGFPISKAVLHYDPQYTHRYFTGREW